jgi:hypothetical protein
LDCCSVTQAALSARLPLSQSSSNNRQRMPVPFGREG